MPLRRQPPQTHGRPHAALANAVGRGDRGWCAYTTRGNTRDPAVLVENLFMDNPTDCAFLLSPEGQQALVDLHVDGIISYLESI